MQITNDSLASQDELSETAARSEFFLPELPSSRWRSLGKRLDYSTWEDRDRFMELDAAIRMRQELELERTLVARVAANFSRGAALVAAVQGQTVPMQLTI